MVPNISRRTLLAGSGAAIGAGVVGVGHLAPTWLPDPVTDALLAVYPEPPGHVWRPPISEEHADEAVTLLEDTVERATELRERVDVASLPEVVAFHLKDSHDPSGGWLESANEKSEPRERLFAATYGMQFAGETVGYAMVALDEFDPTELVERGERLRTQVNEILSSLGEYPVSEPARDLAYIYFVERELSFARLDAPQPKPDAHRSDAAGQDPTHNVASMWGSSIEAKQRVRNARYFSDLYHEHLGEDAYPYVDVLHDALESFTAAINEFPRRSEMRRRVRENLDLDGRTPYGVARWELVMRCFDDDFRFGFDEGGYRAGHTVQRVVEVARTLLARRAHEFALGEIDVSPDNSGFDSGRAFREKRRAVKTFRSVRAEHDSPFAGVLAQEAANLIRSGDIGVGGAWDTDGQSKWRGRVQATAYYLVGNGQMRGLEAVLDGIVDSVE